MTSKSLLATRRFFHRTVDATAIGFRVGLVGALLGSAGLVQAAVPVSFSYSGPPVAIPDGADLSGTAPGAEVGAPITVSGLTGAVAHVSMRIDGTVCTATAGATTVGVDHSFVNDLKLTLRSPAGTQVLVINNTDGGGNNLCQVILDDASTGPSIQSVITANAPFTGTYTPNAPLAAFTGEAANGVWTLLAQDFFSQDTGNIRAWTVTITPADAAVAPVAVPTLSPALLLALAGLLGVAAVWRRRAG